jgi:small acid-soluble spore protein A (major alpha-type SASP)
VVITTQNKLEELILMASTNSGSSRNRVLVPEARQGLERFKYEVASSVGLNDYQNTDKGNLTSRQNGTVGGNMVKQMVEDYENKLTSGR